MHALITAESDVPSSSLRVVASGLGLLGNQLQGLGGLEIETVQLEPSQNLPSEQSDSERVDDNFILGLGRWANESLNVFVSTRALGGGTFGTSIFGGGVALVSTFDKWPRELAAATLRESAHAFGIVDASAARAKASHHCGNLCIMQAVGGTTQGQFLSWAARRLGEGGSTAGFCTDCRTDLRKISVVPE